MNDILTVVLVIFIILTTVLNLIAQYHILKCLKTLSQYKIVAKDGNIKTDNTITDERDAKNDKYSVVYLDDEHEAEIAEQMRDK